MQTKYENKVRIIGGCWRGRRITFADAEGLRPTKDMIREILFNWLAPWIAGSRCLDLFAGSGALGFEAASRGAAEVVLVENNRQTAACLERQKQALSAEQVSVFGQPAEQFMQLEHKPFDIIFLDPPFSTGAISMLLSKINQSGLLDDKGLVYIEIPKSQLGDELPAEYVLRKSKTVGAVHFALLGFQGSDN